MFCEQEKNRIEELTEEINYLKSFKNTLEDELKELNNNHKFEVKELKFELKNAKEEAIKEIEKELNEEKTNRKIAESKVSQLEKAFETMGFDVKRVGDMMDKLVDGLSNAKASKIEIHK